jgi:anthranilate phosphoribosyltransferase
MSFAAYLRQIAGGGERRDLDAEEARHVFGAALDGGIPDLELGALLIALRMKGESLTELLGFYQALAERVHCLISPPAVEQRVAVIGSHGRAGDSPYRTPLVALVLQRLGVPVLVHGPLDDKGRAASAYVFRELGVLPCATLAQAQSQLEHAKLAFVPTAVLAPGLVGLLALRSRLGIGSVANALAPLIDPFPGASLRLVALADAADLDRVRELFLATGDPAIVLVGHGDEPFADPHRRPRIEHFRDGRVELLFHEESSATQSHATRLNDCESRATAAYIKRILDGAAPLPLPIVNEIACCLYGVGLAADLNQAKALAAVQTHSLAAA